MNWSRFTAGVTLIVLLASLASAQPPHGGGVASGGGGAASPNGTVITFPTASTIVDWQGNVWGFGAAWSPNVSSSVASAGGAFITKNAVSQDAASIGFNTWAMALRYQEGVVYSVDPTDLWMEWSDQQAAAAQWMNVAGDPQNYTVPPSTSGTINSTAASPSAVPSEPGWIAK